MIFIGISVIFYIVLLMSVFSMWKWDIVVCKPLFICGISVLLIVLGSMSGVCSETNTMFSMSFIFSGFLLLLYFSNSAICISLNTGLCCQNYSLFKIRYFMISDICYIRHCDKSVDYVCFYDRDNKPVFIIGRYYKNFNELVNIIKELRVVD